MSHTPGPWVVREPEDGELHEIYAENGGDLICYPVWTANQRANVPLIAAAPELLTGLKAAVESLLELAQYEEVAKEMVQTGWFDSAAKAIAKAEGRSE